MKDKCSLLKIVFVAIVIGSVLVLVRVTPQSALAAIPTPARAQPAAHPQQFPVVDAIANKIVQKYQNSTCEQLWQEKAQAKNKPKSAEEQRAIGILHNDAQLRQEFINKVAAPVANKMFECGMIP